MKNNDYDQITYLGLQKIENFQALDWSIGIITNALLTSAFASSRAFLS